MGKGDDPDIGKQFENHFKLFGDKISGQTLKYLEEAVKDAPDIGNFVMGQVYESRAKKNGMPDVLKEAKEYYQACVKNKGPHAEQAQHRLENLKLYKSQD